MGEFSNTFDAYKIERIRITFIPRYGGVTADAQLPAGAPTQNQFYLTIGLDRENQLTPTGTYTSNTYNQFLENVSAVKTVPLDKPFTYSFRPKILDQNNLSSSAIWAPFISCVTPNQFHLGLLAFVHDVNFVGLNNAVFGVDVIYDFDMTFRGQR